MVGTRVGRRIGGGRGRRRSIGGGQSQQGRFFWQEFNGCRGIGQ